MQTIDTTATVVADLDPSQIPEGAIALPTEFTPLPTEKLSELENLNDSLKEGQRQALENILCWLKGGVTLDSCVVLTGYAGTGKGYLSKAIIDNAISLGFARDRIIGLAPTHSAAANLGNFAQIETKTVHSFLGLRMCSIKLNNAQRKELAALKVASSSLDFSPADVARLSLLESLEQAEEEKRKELRPMVNQADFAETFNAALILVDEAYMMDSTLVNVIDELLIYNEWLDVPPKILMMGDPAQLPPIGEKLSKVSKYFHIAHLSEVVRQSGVSLDYVTAVRECEDKAELGYLHQQYLAAGDSSFVRLPQSVIEEHFQSQVKEVGLQNLRVLTTSNARVRELNDSLYRCVYPTRSHDQPYASGDLLLTLGPIMRDPNFPSKPGANEGDILFPTSTPVVVDKAMPPREVTSARGTSYSVSNLFVSAGKKAHEIVAIHPLQMAAWEEEKQLFYKMACSTSTRSKKKGARGQAGDYAKEAWAVFGLKNWGETLSSFSSAEEEERVQGVWRRWAESRTRSRVSLSPGQKLSPQDFNCVKGMLWQEYHGLRQLADSLSLSFASTVHRAQGQTIQLVILDFPKFLPRSGGYVNPDSTWDEQKTLYTAASRVGGENSQLIFMY